MTSENSVTLGRPGAGTPAHAAVAVVTITLDDPVGLRRTIESVADQAFTDHQHVVVDGGSGPRVMEFLRRWESADPQRRLLVTHAPRGIYPAMNEGIRRTTAPLVVVVNGGDTLLPGSLDRIVRHHASDGWRWAYGGTEGRDPAGRTLGEYAFAPFSRRRLRAGLDNVPHPSAVVTRGLYEEIGLYREDLGTAADQEFFLRASLAAEPALVPETLAVFELGGTSSREGLVGRELAWHRLRLASGTAFGGRPSVDIVVTGVLIARRLARSTLGRLRRNVTVLGVGLSGPAAPAESAASGHRSLVEPG